jgi:catalase
MIRTLGRVARPDHAEDFSRKIFTSIMSAFPSVVMPGVSARTDILRTTNRSPMLPGRPVQRPGGKPVRFSTVAGNKGSADLARESGALLKLYTQQGNNIVGNNIPRVFIQDASSP